jgi:hypothetical protein
MRQIFGIIPLVRELIDFFAETQVALILLGSTGLKQRSRPGSLHQESLFAVLILLFARTASFAGEILIGGTVAYPRSPFGSILVSVSRCSIGIERRRVDERSSASLHPRNRSTLSY